MQAWGEELQLFRRLSFRASKIWRPDKDRMTCGNAKKTPIKEGLFVFGVQKIQESSQIYSLCYRYPEEHLILIVTELYSTAVNTKENTWYNNKILDRVAAVCLSVNMH